MSQLFFLATILFPNIGLGLSSSLWKQFFLVGLGGMGINLREHVMVVRGSSVHSCW